MDAFQVATGNGGLQFLQHHGALGSLVLRDVAVPLELVGARTVHVSVYRLPPYVSEEALVQALSQYGKVKGITYPSFRDRPELRTGTRVVKVEMSKTIPNFISVNGFRVMVDYRGLRRVCSRCGQEGHIGPACKTPRCDRCGVFSHPTAGCTTPCLRCGHAHATTDWTQRKSYAVATQSSQDAWPALPALEATRPPVQLQEDSDPSVAHRDPLPPVRDSASSSSSVETTVSAQIRDARSDAAATLGSPDVDSDALSSDSDRLAIGETANVAPRQGKPPPVPAGPASHPTCTANQDPASTSPTPCDPNAASTSGVLATGEPNVDPTPAEDSTEDDTMAWSRSDVKRGRSTASSGQETPHAESTMKKRRGLSTDESDSSDPLVF
ncbi:hypothetical protein HPB47_017643 [Ixodes persulcatus]|uniref:Uncharacterized protein n=1 Tax=Ixodes persulcatus TaxID=34615 RepID=A0AC60QPT8_IXOPE|nr:hypothetical protein HPB47_017643 [Ixodes persulcatus]